MLMIKQINKQTDLHICNKQPSKDSKTHTCNLSQKSQRVFIFGWDDSESKVITFVIEVILLQNGIVWGFELTFNRAGAKDTAWSDGVNTVRKGVSQYTEVFSLCNYCQFKVWQSRFDSFALVLGGEKLF